MKLLQMLQHTIVSCRSDDSVAGVARLMAQEGVGSVVVVDDHGNVAGIVTDRDLVLDVLARDVAPTTPVGSIMTAPVVTVPAWADPLEAVEIMAKSRCRRLPLVDEHGFAVGVVTLDDLLVLLARQADRLMETVEAESARTGHM